MGASLLLAVVLSGLSAGPAMAQEAFVTTWETTSAEEIVFIPTADSPTDYDFTIDWGDGTTETYSGADPVPFHTYNSAGTHTVTITGTFPRIFLDADDFPGDGDQTNARRLQSIEQWGTMNWESMEAAFAGAENVTSNATDKPDLSRVTSMERMFKNASSFNGAIGDWDVSGVTDMEGTFGGATSFNRDIGGWDVSSVTTMKGMFEGASSFNRDIGGWDVSSVQNMNSMFGNADSFDQDIGGGTFPV